MDEDFEIQVIMAALPPGLSGVSAFENGIHYIVINTCVSSEQQEQALEIEKARKYTA